eukprot:GDKK01021061.1.p1 GENE.GDKK01021061.1~~GDKK01021061.1.p1  ORF type:complete len:298 (+),score=7.06 GDKK01021061.1:53-895(+)
MSFFIQCAGTAPNGCLFYFYPTLKDLPAVNATNGSLTVGAVVPMLGPSGSDTNGTVTSDTNLGILRFYLSPLDSSINTFGIFTQVYGSKYWLFVDPSLAATNYMLRFYKGDKAVIPEGSHPAKFQIQAVAGQSYKYLFVPYYGKCVRVGGNSFELSPSNDAMCQMYFHWDTSTGPIPPVPNSYASPSESAKYFIRTRHGHFLESSLDGPHLSATPLHYGQNQQFFFRQTQRPPNEVFTYLMYFAANEDTMICFDDADSIATRTAAGRGEEILILMSGSQR